jgi:hypothetical protein
VILGGARESGRPGSWPGHRVGREQSAARVLPPHAFCSFCGSRRPSLLLARGPRWACCAEVPGGRLLPLRFAAAESRSVKLACWLNPPLLRRTHAHTPKTWPPCNARTHTHTHSSRHSCIQCHISSHSNAQVRACHPGGGAEGLYTIDWGNAQVRRYDTPNVGMG